MLCVCVLSDVHDVGSEYCHTIVLSIACTVHVVSNGQLARVAQGNDKGSLTRNGLDYLLRYAQLQFYCLCL